ncbi:membrane dipeptidase [Flavobacteriaceae bacterium]|nr:membrane dipeptidase [Flavobacteriaceae bacterium]
MKFIFDAHLDLSMNALEWNRDFRLEIEQIRALEAGMTDLPDREKGVVSFPSLRNGNIGLCMATLIARYVKPKNNLPGWNSPQQAWAQTQGQLAWYREMELDGQLVQIDSKKQLEKHLNSWEQHSTQLAIGYILSLEGADSIVSMNHLHIMYQEGLRAIGPAHYGPGTYAFGTDSKGGIGTKGKELLKEIASLQLILDATHLCDQSFWETMKIYDGPVWASHSNVRKQVPNDRQLNDNQIKELLERDAVIGVAFDAWMMLPDWKRGITDPNKIGLNLEIIVNHIDDICQIAGNTEHVMIGSDLDGGFGKEQCPFDLETIEDLQKLDSILSKRGYREDDIENIFSRNGLRFLTKNLPD